MKNKYLFIIKGILLLTAFVIVVVAYYFYVGQNRTLVFEYLESVLLIVVPTIVIFEIIFGHIIGKRIDKNYEINILRHDILIFYEQMTRENMFNSYLDTYTYVIVRNRELASINQIIAPVYKHIPRIKDLDDVFSNKKRVLDNWDKGYYKRKSEFKKALNKYKNFNLRESSTWIVRDTNAYLSHSLFFKNSYTPQETTAFIVAIISLVIAVATALHFKLTWWHLGYFLLSVAIELISFFSNYKAHINGSKEFLEDRLSKLNSIKATYTKDPKAASLAKEAEEKT